MCFVLYVGSPNKLPIIPYRNERPDFNTNELGEEEMLVRGHFSLPHVIYVGSHIGCGCEFRHALYDNGEWGNVVDEEESSVANSQANHQALVNYLKASNLKEFEIYCCWDGDYASPTEITETISIDELLNHEFYFKERVHYCLTIGS